MYSVDRSPHVFEILIQISTKNFSESKQIEYQKNDGQNYKNIAVENENEN